MAADFDRRARRESDPAYAGGRGRVISETWPDGKSRWYAFNPAGDIESVTDEANRRTKYVYDSYNRAIGVIDPASQGTEFEYDRMANMELRSDRGLVDGDKSDESNGDDHARGVYA